MSELRAEQIKKRYNDIRNFDVTATVSLLKAVGS